MKYIKTELTNLFAGAVISDPVFYGNEMQSTSIESVIGNIRDYFFVALFSFGVFLILLDLVPVIKGFIKKK